MEAAGRCDEILDRAAARIVTGPGSYALLTTGAFGVPMSGLDTAVV
jgi:hypothetical protein